MRSQSATQRLVTWLAAVWLVLPCLAGGFGLIPSPINPVPSAVASAFDAQPSMGMAMDGSTVVHLSPMPGLDFIESEDVDSFSKERLSAPPAHSCIRVRELDDSGPTISGPTDDHAEPRAAAGRIKSLRSIQLLL